MALARLIHHQIQKDEDAPGGKSCQSQPPGVEPQIVEIPLYLLKALIHGVIAPRIGGACQGQLEVVQHPVHQLHREIDPVEILALRSPGALNLGLFRDEHRVRGEGIGAQGPIIRQPVDAHDLIFLPGAVFQLPLGLADGRPFQLAVDGIQVGGGIVACIGICALPAEELGHRYLVPHLQPVLGGHGIGEHQHPGAAFVLLWGEAPALYDGGLVFHEHIQGLQPFRAQHGQTVELPVQGLAVFLPYRVGGQEFLHAAL